MKLNSTTVCMPVSDLPASIAWYRNVLELGEPDMVPTEGVVAWKLEDVYLQLFASPETDGGRGILVNFEIENAPALREQFVAQGLDVSELERIEGVVEFFLVSDPDGNPVRFITVP